MSRFFPVDRRAGLILFGVLEILFGVLAALPLSLGTLIYRLVEPEAGTSLTGQPMYLVAAVYFVVAVALVWLGIGSIMCRRWACALLLVLAWSWLVAGVVVLGLFFALIPGLAKNLPSDVSMWVVFAVVGAFLTVVFILIPTAMVLFYQSGHVKATCEARDPVVRWTDACPPTILATSVWFVIGALYLLVLPLAYRSVIPFFGVLLTGPPAAAAIILCAALSLYLARAFYRLQRAGWWLGLVLLLLFGASASITFFRIDPLEFYRQMGYADQLIERMRDYRAVSGGFLGWSTAIFSLLLLVFFLWIRKYFWPK